MISKVAVVNEVAKTLAPMGFTRKDVKLVLETFQGHVTTNLLADKRVRVLDFGVIETVQRKARIGRNPQTGSPVEIPSRRSVKFRISKTTKDKI